jgi:hypothetical protein
MRRLLAVLALLALVPPAEAQRHRAVRPPAPPCAFSVSLAYPDPVPDAGMLRGRMIVTPSPASCTSWNAYSPVDWIVIEAGAAANELAITVRPNEVTTPRAANLLVAGLEVPLTQLGRPETPIIETGIVKNGTFAKDLANWGWQDRFPNGVGTVSWSAVDANGSATSGSILLRSTAIPGPGIQSLQCVSITPGQVYEYRFAIRLGPETEGVAVTSVLDLDSADCTGPYAVRFTEQITGDASRSWQRRTATFRAGFEARSALIVLASKTKTNAAFDAHFDDIVLTQQ